MIKEKRNYLDNYSPELSVIIPVYNVEKYLRRCVNSALNQSFSDFELILVDDGSSDSSPRICDEYAHKDYRVLVIHKDNEGQSSARNAGLDVAKGKYIYFIDSDDYIEQDLFRNAIESMHTCDMVTINCRLVDENGSETGTICFPPSVIDLKNDSARFTFLTADYFDFRVGFSPWQHFYRKKLIDEHKLRFEDNRKIFAEDLLFNFCYLMHAETIECIPRVYYNYLQRNDSTMGVQARKYNFGRMNELSKEAKKYVFANDTTGLLKENYSLIHSQIINNVLQRAINNEPDLNLTSVRKIMREEITDIDYFIYECLGLKNCYPVLRERMGRLPAMELCCRFSYYADGNPILIIAIKVINCIFKINEKRKNCLNRGNNF